MVPEAQDAYASVVKHLRALSISSLATGLVVLPPVYFDSEFGGGAIEVQHEALDGMLLSEAEAIHLPSAEARPQEPLGIGHALAKVPGGIEKPFGNGGGLPRGGWCGRGCGHGCGLEVKGAGWVARFGWGYGHGGPPPDLPPLGGGAGPSSRREEGEGSPSGRARLQRGMQQRSTPVSRPNQVQEHHEMIGHTVPPGCCPQPTASSRPRLPPTRHLAAILAPTTALCPPRRPAPRQPRARTRLQRVSS